MKKDYFKINNRGGILSLGDLNNIVASLKKSEVKNIELGERQTLQFFTAKKYSPELTENLRLTNIDFEINSNKFQNIISSYAAVDIFSNHPWMEEGTYRDILNAFNYKPELKINITDYTQALSPMYTGNLNFITSTHINYFYLYITHPLLGEDMYLWPKFIYSTDIAPLSKLLEIEFLKNKTKTIEELFNIIDKKIKFNYLEIDKPLSTPRLRFPYYEGMNKMGDKYWLGIYRRNYDFSTDFLESIQWLCTETTIAQINITSRRSLLIKGIKEEDRIEWEKLLSKHGINSRHSSQELNWQTADNDPDSIQIKNELIKDFNKFDIRTYGISFAIFNNKPFDISSAIIIKRNHSLFPFTGFLKRLSVFEIYFTPDFSLNATHYKMYAANVPWNDLFVNLKNLCEQYYIQLRENTTTKPKEQKNKLIPKTEKTIYQCSHCLTVYDEQIGDPEQGIPPNTSFYNLPTTYTCFLCENSIKDYRKITIENLLPLS